MNKLTAFNAHSTSEGKRVTMMYSVIDQDGVIRETNKRESLIIMDEAILAKINEIENYLNERLAQR